MYRPSERSGTIDWTGKTILVADDYHTNFLLLEAIMEKTNVRLIWAKNGREAVEMCHHPLMKMKYCNQVVPRSSPSR